MKNITLLFAVLALTSTSVFASDEAFLDKPYKGAHHPRIDIFSLANTPVKSDVAAAISKQTAVKSQAARGSCSIFSATALLESMMVINGKADASLDLSEEWLQYLIAQWATNDGSNSNTNFDQIHKYGMPAEVKMPYIGLTWKSLSDGNARERCAHITSRKQANCLTGHRDPALLLKTDEEILAESGKLSDVEFVEARKDAMAFKETNLTGDGERASGYAGSTTEIKELLAAGTPLTLDITFYYGAWNHRMAEEMGINRDLGNWAKGIVSYPEQGSMDLEHSSEHAAGHSVVIVGYDDEREIEYTVKMTDGSMKQFKRKGVYYFKNSWGTGAFGVDFEIDGVKAPGYGMISQEYANEIGSFFKLAL